MCGIAGWINWKNDLSSQHVIVESMINRIKSRGPDDDGIWISKHALLGHCRLIVVDPEGGKQPMIKQYHDNSFVLIYNGELYNTPELRRELADKGHQFTSHSDTEVLLFSFIEWGPSCVTKFNGIYSFAIWDEAKQSLFLARDRMGVKPLFYTWKKDSFIFGSEIKAILAHPDVKPELDAEGLSEVFGLGPARTPGHGVFKDIKEIRPGYCIYCNEYGSNLYPYWKLNSMQHEDNLEQTTEKVFELVQDAAKRQMVADVPVCTFLSGGLDSSALSAFAAKVAIENQHGPLHTFSIDYKDNDLYFVSNNYQPDSDAPWVKKMVNYLHTHHHFITLDTSQLIDTLEDAMKARDLPGMADVDSSLYLSCKEIKKEATVAISGECADEIFGGYPWFYQEEALNAHTFPWSRALDFRKQLLSQELQGKVNLDEYVTRRYQETLKEVPYLDDEEPLEAKRREMFYLNMNWFMATLLDRKDRMSMASGLEVRVPFCDHRIAEYVWNIPWAMKTWDQREKGILRKALKGILPDEVLMRKKSPYPKTHNPAYAKAIIQVLLERLNDPSSCLHTLINVPLVRSLVQSFGTNTQQPWFGQLMAGPQFFAFLIQVDQWFREYKIQLI